MLIEDTDFAVIGMACRFPGAENYTQYWNNLIQGKNCIVEVPKDRWDWREYFGDPRTDTNKTNIKWGGFIEDIDKFDPLFFNISPKEAAYIDPQHRLFLQTAWQSIEDAGYSVDSLAGRKIGIYAGVSKNDYSELMRESRNEIAPFISTGTVHSILTNRLSFLFDFHGRSESVDTACSSSLVALHNAMRDISNGECESALVGGVNALLAPTMFISHSKSGMLSIDGQCKTFDSGANGYVRGEGAGVLFIKPLKKALEDGDYIHAVIKSSAINHGGRANSLTSPTVEAQAEVISAALDRANIDPATISYIEAHGTGTPLGDPIEINALKKAFKSKQGQSTKVTMKGTSFCALGSVKTNIGHLESASGIAGIIKAILAMQHKEIPALLNFAELNPYIDLKESPFYVADRNIKWKELQYADGGIIPRRVGVSSFGMGGVNAHIILEEAPAENRITFTGDETAPQLILISSRKVEGLKNQAENLLHYLSDPNNHSSRLQDIAYTLQNGRDQFTERLALIVSSKQELMQKLTDYIQGKEQISTCFVGSVIVKKGEKPQIIKARAEMDLIFLSAQWIRGTKLDWTECYSDKNKPARIPLPTYAFMKKRCWYNQENSPAPKQLANQKLTFSEQNNDLKMAEIVFKKTLCPSDFYIRDHVVQGEKLLPGVFYLEIARSAYSQIVGNQVANTLHNIYWISPVIVKDQEINININIKIINRKTNQPQQEALSNFQIMHNNFLHSRGEIGYSDLSTLDLSPLDIPSIKQRCPSEILQQEIYQLFVLNGLNYGPTFQPLQKAHYSDQAIFSELNIPQSLVENFDEFVLHPSTMDGIFQTIVALSLLGFNRLDKQYVPYYLERIDIIKPIPAHCFVYAYAHSKNNRSNGEIKFDAVVCNDKGELLIKISGLTKRVIELQPNQINQKKEIKKDQIQISSKKKTDIYYHSVWRDSPLQEKVETLDQIIVFGDDEQLIQQIIEVAPIARESVLLITAGNGFQVNNKNQIQINPGDPDDYLKMVQFLKDEKINIKNILYLWNFYTNEPASGDPIENGIVSILHLTKAIISKKAYKNTKLIYCYPAEKIVMLPYHALIGGFARTLAYENPNMHLYTMGIDKKNEGAIIKLACRELTSRNNCKLQEISYLGDQRLERKIISFNSSVQYSQENTLLKRNGVYLITGGAGGLGFIFAKYLSERYRATVLLIGRTKLNTQIKEKITAIQSFGGQCMYFNADITQSDELQKIFLQIKNACPRIHGVIHAAGIIEDSYILLKKEESFRRVINTKVRGLRNLDDVTRNEKLEFFCMFSSIAALMPNQGQSDYAAANSFLDSFADMRNRLKDENKRSGVSLAINWPLWANGGMRVTQEEEAHLLREFGMKPLEENLGIEIFEQGLLFADCYNQSNSLSHIVAIEGDKEKITKCLGINDQEKSRSEISSFHEIKKKERDMESIAKNAIETEVKNKFSELFYIPAENIDIEMKIREFGLDSNSMVSIIRHFNAVFQIDLKPTVFFEIDSIDQFVQCISEHCQEKQTVVPTRHNTTLIDIDASHPSNMQFQRTFKTSEFYLRDHVVEDQYNMPGACYIEMARQAGDLILGDNSIVKLTNNYWARQLSSPLEDFTAYINIFPKSSIYEYEIISYNADHEKVIHAIGSLTSRGNNHSAAADNIYFDLNAVRSRCSFVQHSDEVYKQIVAEGLHVGSTFKPMQKILLSKGEALATLTLPDNVQNTLDDYVLHPSMLTGVFQTALISNRFNEENQSTHFIPMGIDELEIHAPVTNRCLVYSKSHKSNDNLKKFDLLVCREDGLVAIRLKGFAIRALKNINQVESLISHYPEQNQATTSKNPQQLLEGTYHYIKSLLSKHVGLSIYEIDNDESFDAYGINSIMIVELNKSFEDAFGSLSRTLFFEYRNIKELAEYFIDNHTERLKQITAGTRSGVMQNQQAEMVAIEEISKDINPSNQADERIQLSPLQIKHRKATNITNKKPDSAYLQELTRAYIKRLLSPYIGLAADEIDENESFEAYGINSVMIVELNRAFEKNFGSLSRTLFFEYRNIEELVEYFIEDRADRLYELLGLNHHDAAFHEDDGHNLINIAAGNQPINEPIKSNTPDAVFKANNRNEPAYINDDIAIIGIDGRYPGANNINEFWEILKNGSDCVVEIPDSHFDYKPIFDADPEHNKIYSKRGSFIDHVDKFDASFFNISPREAELIDPQERLFLEVAWGTIEDAGYTRQTLLSSSNRQVGVFVGALWQPYQAIGTEETLKGNIVAPSGLLYSIANRVSYFMNFSGPSLAIDTACSSSLTAVHIACQSLISGDCKLAIAGGVNLSLHSSKYLFLSQNRFLSTDGRCRSFGDGGDGYVPGEGVGAILLKPLSEAIKDGDHIHAILKGSSINHGGKTNGYTVPCPKAQSETIKQVHKKTGINPRTISYIEAHGTGTALGDPIEISGLQKAFEVATLDKQFCAIGSVKSNIGHLEAAAGIASITKVILQIKNKQLAPSIHSSTLNSNINFEQTPFVVQRELSQWQQPTLDIDGVSETYPRRAGISSFGAGGSNAHILLEEFNPIKTTSANQDADGIVMIVLSAKNDERLGVMAANLLNYLDRNYLAGSLNDLAYTLQVGREAMNERLGILASSVEELRSKLKAYLNKDKYIEHLYSGNAAKHKDMLAFFGDDGDTTRSIIEKWIANAKYDKLINFWVKGFNIDWDMLYQSKPHRISLPTYPFAKERYWIPSRHDQNIKAKAIEISQLHPLLHENKSTLTQQQFGSIFTGNEFFLKDHIVGSGRILPAVAYIEMFRAAASLSNDEFEPFKLYNLTWLKPITQETDPRQVLIEIAMEEDEFYLQASTKTNGESTVHAQGQCLYLSSQITDIYAEIHHQIKVDKIQENLQNQVQSTQVYELFHSKGLNLQKGFQGINWIKWNENQALGRITLPSFLNTIERESYFIHPSLLDSALQTALYVLETEHSKEGALFLPYSIEEVELYSTLPDTIYSLVQPCDSRTMSDSEHAVRSFNLTLLDTDDNILMKVKNISFRETNLSTGDIQNLIEPKKNAEIAFFSPAWMDVTTKNNDLADVPATGFVIISNNDEKLKQLSARLAQTKVEMPVIEVALVEEYVQEIPGRIYLNVNNEAEYHRLTAFLSDAKIEVSHIAYLWDSAQQNAADWLFAQTQQALVPLFNIDKSLLHITRSIKQLFVNFCEQGTSQWVLEGGVHGFLNSISAEYPKTTHKIISMELNKIGEISWVDNVLDELLYSVGEKSTWIRYRENAEHRQQWQLQPINEINIKDTFQLNYSAIKAGGTYLISGGMGGIAKILIQYLAGNYNVNLILLGRSHLDTQGEAFLENIKSPTASAIYFQADITDLDSLTQTISQAKNHFGAIDGVIHCAGVIEDNLLLNKSIQSLQRVMQPKLQGTVNLDEVTRSEPLDFFLVFSSITSVLGNPGQCDYGAANGFMDAFIAHREVLVEKQVRHGLSLAINWPFWNDGKMGQDTDVLSMLDDSFGLPLNTIEGINCFEQIFHFRKNQIVIIKKEKSMPKPVIKQDDRVVNDHAYQNQTRKIVAADDLIARLQTDTRYIVAELGKFNPEQISMQTDFMALGFESVILARLASYLNKKFTLKLSPALFFEHTNLEKLSAHLLDEHKLKISAYYERMLQGDAENLRDISGFVKPHSAGPDAILTSVIAQSKQTQKIRSSLKQQNKTSVKSFFGQKKETMAAQSHSTSDIAVIGMDCLFPGASDLQSLWKLLVDCQSTVTEVPADRWDWQAIYGDPSKEANKTNIKWGCFVDDLDKFDTSFFNISPYEAALMDPQQRVLLQSVWKSIEHAGYAPMELSKNFKVGFFVGTSGNDYYELLMNSNVEAYSATGSLHSIAANRVSYYFDFNGPSLAIDTACSSALVALDTAVKSLEQGSCDVAIAGGVNALISPSLYISLGKAGMLSPSGNISPLDKKANGYVRGEGVGILVLKRLDKAIQDNDVIHAVIKGTSVNHGGKVPSLTVPNPKAQAELILDACNKAKVDVSTLNYIEMHGTGTPLGDPIEVNGLKSAFKNGQEIEGSGYCGIASVKGNIGHLEAAAGIAGVIKTILALKNKTLPGQCQFEELNPHIQLEDTPFRVVQDTQPWVNLIDKNGKALPRRAGVSSFGFGGANAHVILEEYRDERINKPSTKIGEWNNDVKYPIVLSARTEERLIAMGNQFIDYLDNPTNRVDEPINLERMAYTLQMGRSMFDYRLGVIVKEPAELQTKLQEFISGSQNIEGLYVGHIDNNVIDHLPSITKAGNNVIDTWLQEGRLDNVLAAWVKGTSVDWSKLYDDKPQRCSLPTYPFAKERYWIASSIDRELATHSLRTVDYPLSRAVESERKSNSSIKADIETLMPSLRTIEPAFSLMTWSSTYLQERTTGYLKQLAGSILQMPVNKIDSSRSLEVYGMDSILVMQVINCLSKNFSGIDSNLLMEYRTIDALSDYLIETHKDALIKIFKMEDQDKENVSDAYSLSSIDEIANAVVHNKINFKDALSIIRQSVI